MEIGRELLIVDNGVGIRQALDTLRIGYQALTREKACEIGDCLDAPKDAVFLLTDPPENNDAWEIFLWLIAYWQRQHGHDP